MLSQEDKKISVRLTMNALRYIQKEDWPPKREALKSDDKNKWRDAINYEPTALQSLKCWNIAVRLRDIKKIHTHFALARRPDLNGGIRLRRCHVA